jgi:hypothetical protein
MTQIVNNTTRYILEIREGGAVTTIASIAMADLTDVSAGATTGQVLQYNGATWEPYTLPTIPPAVTGFVPPAATDNQFMRYDEALGEWEAFTLTPEFVLPEAQEGDLLQFDGTQWVVVHIDFDQGGGDGSTVLEEDLTSTENVGGIDAGDTLVAGTTLEEVFRTMLITYQEPVMTLSGWTTGTYEHGATYPADTDFVLSFTNDVNIDAGVNGSWIVADSFIANSSGTALPEDGTTSIPSYTGTLLVDNVNAGAGVTSRGNAASLTVSGFQNTNGGTIGSKTKSSTVRFRYWVLDSATTLGQNPTDISAQIMLAGADLQLDGTGAGVIESGLISSVSDLGLTTSGSYDFVYWLLPQAFTVNSITQNTSLNLYAGDTADQTTAVIYLGTVDITNQHGQTVAMQLLRSKVSNAFAPGSVIAFS